MTSCLAWTTPAEGGMRVELNFKQRIYNILLSMQQEFLT